MSPFAAPAISSRRTEQLTTDRSVWLISDLHLGDGTPSDAFYGKDRHLLAFMERVEKSGGTLIVNGDALDFQQAWGFVRILRAHTELLNAMSWLGKQGRLYYVIGNHDYDINVFAEILSLRVCHELVLNQRILVRHGYEYDPYITEMLDDGQWHTVVHHLVERWLGTWIRFPLSEFYTVANRLSVWLMHKLGSVAALGQRMGRWLDDDSVGAEVLAHLDLWCWSNQGDCMGIFRPALQDALSGRWDGLICGHSHIPGVVRQQGRFYANTGSWTFGSSQYLLLEGDELHSRDWMSGRTYTDQNYRHLLDGSVYERDFFQWWRENYMGMLRFREGEERRGRVPGWQAWAAPHAPVARLPAPARPGWLRRAPRPSPVSAVPPSEDLDGASFGLRAAREQELPASQPPALATGTQVPP